jgi:hypothetical protein
MLIELDGLIVKVDVVVVVTVERVRAGQVDGWCVLVKVMTLLAFEFVAGCGDAVTVTVTVGKHAAEKMLLHVRDANTS